VDHGPGVVPVPTIHDHETTPLASAVFGGRTTSPALTPLAPPLTCTTKIMQWAPGSVATVTVALEPRATGDVTDTKRTNGAAGGAGVDRTAEAGGAGGGVAEDGGATPTERANASAASRETPVP
jgi:hypothetical protein